MGRERVKAVARAWVGRQQKDKAESEMPLLPSTALGPLPPFPSHPVHLACSLLVESLGMGHTAVMLTQPWLWGPKEVGQS